MFFFVPHCILLSAPPTRMVSISLTSTSGVFRYGKGQKNAGGHVEASAGEEDDGIGMRTEVPPSKLVQGDIYHGCIG